MKISGIPQCRVFFRHGCQKQIYKWKGKTEGPWRQHAARPYKGKRLSLSHARLESTTPAMCLLFFFNVILCHFLVLLLTCKVVVFRQRLCVPLLGRNQEVLQWATVMKQRVSWPSTFIREAFFFFLLIFTERKAHSSSSSRCDSNAATWRLLTELKGIRKDSKASS